jgi:hypothetical protein
MVFIEVCPIVLFLCKTREGGGGLDRAALSALASTIHRSATLDDPRESSRLHVRTVYARRVQTDRSRARDFRFRQSARPRQETRSGNGARQVRFGIRAESSQLLGSNRGSIARKREREREREGDVPSRIPLDYGPLITATRWGGEGEGEGTYRTIAPISKVLIGENPLAVLCAVTASFAVAVIISQLHVSRVSHLPA